MKHLILASPLVLAALFIGGEIAHAQPGATPPGSVPPYSAPPPAPAPAPGPYGPSAPPPSDAYSQPYYQQPMPPPAPSNERSGWNIGLSLGVGSMESSNQGGFACQGCEADPPTGAFDIHVGTMLMDRLALQGEIWIHSRRLDRDGMSNVSQSMALIALQYWLSPRLWIKGGFGFANLSLNYNDGFEEQSEHLGSGAGYMAAIGYELMHSRGFGLDVQLKGGSAGYAMNGNEEVSIGTIALGLNWY